MTTSIDFYSNVNRGKRRKAEGEAPPAIEEVSEAAPSAAKRACLCRARPRQARLIKQVYEVDPLVCPRCGEPMRIIAFIEQAAVIEKILTAQSDWADTPGQSGVAGRGHRSPPTTTLPGPNPGPAPGEG